MFSAHGSRSGWHWNSFSKFLPHPKNLLRIAWFSKKIHQKRYSILLASMGVHAPLTEHVRPSARLSRLPRLPRLSRRSRLSRHYRLSWLDFLSFLDFLYSLRLSLLSRISRHSGISWLSRLPRTSRLSGLSTRLPRPPRLSILSRLSRLSRNILDSTTLSIWLCKIYRFHSCIVHLIVPCTCFLKDGDGHTLKVKKYR